MYRAITARRTFEKAQLEAEEAGEDVLKHELWLKWGQPVLAVSATDTEKQKAESDIAATKERLRKAVRAAEFAKGIANRKKVEWDEAENVAREKRALLREIFDARKAKAAEMMALEAAAAEVKHIQGPEGDLHAIALTLPTCSDDAAVLAENALSNSTQAMEDFLLRGARRSVTGITAIRMLRDAIAACPYHGKAWYRFGLLLRRSAGFLTAATLALEHSITLRPDRSGPAYAELTLLHLDQLMERPGPNGLIPNGLAPEACVAVPRFYTSPAAGGGSGVSDTRVAIRGAEGDAVTELTRKLAHTHANALMLNRGLTLRSIRDMWAGGGKRGKPRGPENETSIDEVIAAALQEQIHWRQHRQKEREQQERMRRHRKPAEDEGDPESLLPADLKSCEAARARRDVLRLRRLPGDVEAANEIDEQLYATLGGRYSLPAPIYIDPRFAAARERIEAPSEKDEL